MIDTHCHLLPGLDDGPPDLPAARELAVQLVRQGISEVVCTPHLSRRYPVERAQAQEALQTLTADLQGAGIALRLHLAAEVTPERVLQEGAERLQPRAIAGRFLLVEIVQPTPLATLALMQATLAPHRLTAVFGHPERCRAVQRHPEALAALRDEGALVQVVAPSLLGRWGPEASATAWKLIDQGLVDLLGSDAHGFLRRRPHLRAAADLVAERFGEDARTALTERTPGRLLEHAADGPPTL
jgi:protein-tyrosine phosphatase